MAAKMLVRGSTLRGVNIGWGCGLWVSHKQLTGPGRGNGSSIGGFEGGSLGLGVGGRDPHTGSIASGQLAPQLAGGGRGDWRRRVHTVDDKVFVDLHQLEPLHYALHGFLSRLKTETRLTVKN